MSRWPVICGAAVSAASAGTPRPAQEPARPDPLYHLVWLALSSGVLLAAALLSVKSQTQVVLPLLGIPLPELCTMRRMLGMDCPGCGMTRCFIALAHGDIRAAWSFNPAGLWLFAILAFQLPFRASQLWRIRQGRGEWTMNGAAQVALAVFAIALVGQWTLRVLGIGF